MTTRATALGGMVRRRLTIAAMLIAMLVGGGVAEAERSRQRPRAQAVPTRAKPRATATTRARPNAPAPTRSARIPLAIGGILRDGPVAVTPASRDPLERAAASILELYAGPLRAGTTSLFVADARTGQALLEIQPDLALNPASNVKLVSTATALDLVGPDFRYRTTVLGPTLDADGTASGDLFLRGTYDPTLTARDLEAVAASLAARGLRRLDGGIRIGEPQTRDGIYRASIPLTIRAGAKAGAPATVEVPPHYGYVVIDNQAKTGRKKRSKLSVATAVETDPAGHRRLRVTVRGTVGAKQVVTRAVGTKDRAYHAGHVLLAALRGHGVVVRDDVAPATDLAYAETAAAAGWLPVELAHHVSAPLGDIVSRINKRSINWLADRVVMTTSALVAGREPSMEGAIAAMYAFVERTTPASRAGLVLDTGSGLSYRTQFSARQVAEVLRAGAGYRADGLHGASAVAYAHSLAVAGRDGTLRGRFRAGPAQDTVVGKTGTLSNVVALSGFIGTNPDRPLVFAIVTNGHAPRLKTRIRAAHERLVTALCGFAGADLVAHPPAQRSADVAAADAPDPSVPDEDAELGIASDDDAVAAEPTE